MKNGYFSHDGINNYYSNYFYNNNNNNKKGLGYGWHIRHKHTIFTILLLLKELVNNITQHTITYIGHTNNIHLFLLEVKSV